MALRRNLKKKTETAKAHTNPNLRWHGTDTSVFYKPGANPNLTHWGRNAILDLYDEGVSPLRIAVKTGISHFKVQQILHDLRDREPDFDFQTYEAFSRFQSAF